MERLIISNIIMGMASVISFRCILCKSKDKLLRWQTAEGALGALAQLVAGGMTGFCTSIAAMARSIVLRKFNITWKIKWIFVVASMSGIILAKALPDYIAVLGSTIYCITVLQSMDVQKIRYALIINLICGIIYSLHVKVYPGLITNTFLLISTTIVIVKEECRRKAERLQNDIKLEQIEI